MFESAELGHRVDKQTYAREVPKLREALLNAQFDLKEQRRFPGIILISGLDGAGKGETVNLLNEWMDPRHIQTVAFGDPTDEEAERPRMWRFWRSLPPRGRIGILFGHWYTVPLQTLANVKQSALTKHLEEIQRFEEMLGHEGALILKFWFHLTRANQKARLKTLAADPKNDAPLF